MSAMVVCSGMIGSDGRCMNCGQRAETSPARCIRLIEAQPAPTVTRAEAVKAAGRAICQGPMRKSQLANGYYDTLHPNSQALWDGQAKHAIQALEALGVCRFKEG